MGHILVKVRFQNPNDGHFVDETSLVDTGATHTVVPDRVATRLRLKTLGSVTVETGKGRLRLKQALCKIHIRRRSMVLPVLVSKHIRRVLIGVTTLESMALSLDPLRGKLIPGRILLYRALRRHVRSHS